MLGAPELAVKAGAVNKVAPSSCCCSSSQTPVPIGHRHTTPAWSHLRKWPAAPYWPHSLWQRMKMTRLRNHTPFKLKQILTARRQESMLSGQTLIASKVLHCHRQRVHPRLRTAILYLQEDSSQPRHLIQLCRRPCHRLCIPQSGKILNLMFFSKNAWDAQLVKSTQNNPKFKVTQSECSDISFVF